MVVVTIHSQRIIHICDTYKYYIHNQVDPLTGEGIHCAMQAARIASQCLCEMFLTGDFSLAACEAYSLRCWDLFGWDFIASQLAAVAIYRFPILLDAVAVAGARRGQVL